MLVSRSWSWPPGLPSQKPAGINATRYHLVSLVLLLKAFLGAPPPPPPAPCLTSRCLTQGLTISQLEPRPGQSRGHSLVPLVQTLSRPETRRLERHEAVASLPPKCPAETDRS